MDWGISGWLRRESIHGVVRMKNSAGMAGSNALVIVTVKLPVAFKVAPSTLVATDDHWLTGRVRIGLCNVA